MKVYVKHGWPSGLRRQFKVLFSSGAWVRTPQAVPYGDTGLVALMSCGGLAQWLEHGAYNLKTKVQFLYPLPYPYERNTYVRSFSN